MRASRASARIARLWKTRPMPYRTVLFRFIGRLFAGLAAAGLAATVSTSTVAAPKTVCTVTINSPDERDVMQRHLPQGQYRFVELVQRGRPDWFGQACRSGVRCDTLVISVHFADGTEFYTDRFDDREFLSVHELQRASCSPACAGLFEQLKEVYLFGCNTLQSAPRYVASGEIARSLARAGHSRDEAQRVSALLGERYGQSNRDRLRHVFKDVPVLYGFSSKAPLGRVAGPMLERYFQSAPAGEVAGGRPSPTLLKLFGPSSMIAVSGLTDGDPHAGFRRDMCSLVDDGPAHGRKLAFVHEVLRRDVAEVRMFLDHLERYLATVGPQQRGEPEVAAALEAIRVDDRTRERVLEFVRDADDASVQARMLALSRTLGWLTPAQERSEFLRLIARRMARDDLGRTEVDLVCSAHSGHEPALAGEVQAEGAARRDRVTHAAVLACLGSAEAHRRTVQALTSGSEDEVAIAQVYLRHRPLADVADLRTVTSGIAAMSAANAQVRALEALARQRLADPQSLEAIARLFPRARSLEVQRAIAGLLIRSDVRSLASIDLVRSLREHRLKSPDGTDVIDMLIRVLQGAS